MLISTILSVLGLGVICWVLFNLAVYALPFFVAMTVGYYLHGTDTGIIAVIVGAFLAGGFTLALGQVAFATIRSVPIRLVLGALYAIPAGLAGFHAIKGLSAIGGAGETWALVYAGIGTIIVGTTAWARVATLAGSQNHSQSAPQASTIAAGPTVNGG